MPDKLRKRLLTALKIGVSALLIYFIFTKINFTDVIKTLKTGNPLYLLLGTLLVLISKVIASYRLNLYFHQIGIRITQGSNLRLYFLGMFYNLFLPGGIGGDAYKGYVVQKRFKSSAKKVVSVLLLDRLSGMLLIFIYSCILAFFIKNEFFGLLLNRLIFEAFSKNCISKIWVYMNMILLLIPFKYDSILLINTKIPPI